MVSLPIKEFPEKKSTLEIVPSASDALAVTVMLAGAVKLEPVVGAVRLILGAVLFALLVVSINCGLLDDASLELRSMYGVVFEALCKAKLTMFLPAAFSELT